MLRIVSLAALLALPQASLACIGWDYERHIFFKTLPESLQNAPLIAKVRIVNEAPNQSYGDFSIQDIDVQFPLIFVVVEVIKNIKGTEIGVLLNVDISAPPCSYGDRVVRGTEWVIAGSAQEGIFIEHCTAQANQDRL